MNRKTIIISIALVYFFNSSVLISMQEQNKPHSIIKEVNKAQIVEPCLTYPGYFDFASVVDANTQREIQCCVQGNKIHAYNTYGRLLKEYVLSNDMQNPYLKSIPTKPFLIAFNSKKFSILHMKSKKIKTVEGTFKSLIDVDINTDKGFHILGTLQDSTKIWNAHGKELMSFKYKSPEAIKINNAYRIFTQDDGHVYMYNLQEQEMQKWCRDPGFVRSAQSIFAQALYNNKIVFGTSRDSIEVHDMQETTRITKKWPGRLINGASCVVNTNNTPQGWRILSTHCKAWKPLFEDDQKTLKDSAQTLTCKLDTKYSPLGPGKFYKHTDNIKHLDNTIHIWDTEGNHIAECKGHVASITALDTIETSEGWRIISSDNIDIHVWDLNGKKLATMKNVSKIYDAYQELYYVTRSFHVVKNKSEIYIVSWSILNDNKIKIWNLQGELLIECDNQEHVKTINIQENAQGEPNIIAQSDNAIRVWDILSVLTNLKKADERQNKAIRYVLLKNEQKQNEKYAKTKAIVGVFSHLFRKTKITKLSELWKYRYGTFSHDLQISHL